MSVACSSPPLLSSSSCSTATLDAQWVLCRTSTTTIHAQCSLPDLNHDHPAQCSLPGLNHDHPRPVFPAGPQPRVSLQVFPAGPHVGRSGTKNVQKKVRKNVRQVCYILVANSRVCGRVTGAMPLLTGPSFWMWRSNQKDEARRA